MTLLAAFLARAFILAFFMAFFLSRLIHLPLSSSSSLLEPLSSRAAPLQLPGGAELEAGAEAVAEHEAPAEAGIELEARWEVLREPEA